MAKEKVRLDGYEFKKGYSRSTAASSNSESEPETKKKKHMYAEERKREIDSLQQQIHSLIDQIRVKKMRIDKALTTKAYKVCDNLEEEKRKLIREQTILENQLAAIKKKDHRSKSSTKPLGNSAVKQVPRKKANKAPKKKTSQLKLVPQSPYSSDNSTLILSDDEEDQQTEMPWQHNLDEDQLDDVPVNGDQPMMEDKPDDVDPASQSIADEEQWES